MGTTRTRVDTIKCEPQHNTTQPQHHRCCARARTFVNNPIPVRVAAHDQGELLQELLAVFERHALEPIDDDQRGVGHLLVVLRAAPGRCARSHCWIEEEKEKFRAGNQPQRKRNRLFLGNDHYRVTCLTPRSGMYLLLRSGPGCQAGTLLLKAESDFRATTPLFLRHLHEHAPKKCPTASRST